jgi:hypothetical protein
MKPIYKKNLTTVALIWAGCVIMLLLIYMLVLAPQSKSRKMIEKDLDEKKQQYQSALAADKEETKIQIRRHIEELQSRLKDFVVDFEDSANLTFDIGEIARDQQISSFNIKAKGKSGVSMIPNCDYICESEINIGFTARFNQFAVFLNTLERHRPVIFVDEFTVTRSRNKEDFQHRSSLNVAVFVKKQ